MDSSKALTCDLFCTVVDNFGDIGVCWRLARQLADEHDWQVRLFVDDLQTFVRLAPSLDLAADSQTLGSIVVELWHAPRFAADTPARSGIGRGARTPLDVADVVIEAFACDLPPAYLAAMAARSAAGAPPVWINLEYLSAEDWVPAFHLRPSPHPRHPLTKIFFFPGLGPGTGGVLKERTLDAQRQAFADDPQARAAWFASADIPPPAANATVISMFAYENPALDALLEQWRDGANGASPVVLLVPQGRVSGAVARFFGLQAFAAGAHATLGALRAHALPFTEQSGYDRLLWASDINFVRGEDSFVRAQWACKPFVWHIYPQADDAHLPKLEAALDHLGKGLPDAAAGALTRFWHRWNDAPCHGMAQGAPDWAEYAAQRAALTARAANWSRELSARGDLATHLVKLAKDQLK
jgi:uncharacterized repeat protein (TIGR03837 family)